MVYCITQWVLQSELRTGAKKLHYWQIFGHYMNNILVYWIYIEKIGYFPTAKR